GWRVGREALTVDALAAGRLVVGVGIGDQGAPAFTHFSEELDTHVRAELLDEGLAILAGLWTGEPFSFRGKHFRIDEVTFLPRSTQTPRIPIWIGGGYPTPRSLEPAPGWGGSGPYPAARGARTGDGR